MYSLKSIKTFTGMEGTGLNANLCLNGKKVAFILDEGCGGETDIRFDSKKDEDAFFTFAATWWETAPEGKMQWDLFNEENECNLEAYPHSKAVDWVNAEVSRIESNKRFKRLSKTRTLFHIKTDPVGQWKTVNVPYSPKSIEWIKAKYRDQVESIFNPNEV